MKDCQDYECRCERFVEDCIPGITAPGYCRCGCPEDAHGAGFDGAGLASADQGRAAVEAMFR